MSELMEQGGQEVIGVGRIEGPILVVEGAGSIGFDEVVEVKDSQGKIRLGRVLEVGEGFAVVEVFAGTTGLSLSLIHISEPTRLGMISYAVFCLKKKKK